MDPRKARQKNGRTKATGELDDQLIDATPDADADNTSPRSQHSPRPADSNRPRNLQETRVWKDFSGGAMGVWKQYRYYLVLQFNRIPRQGQELFITRLSQTVSIGGTMILIGLIYNTLPLLIRVLILPPLVIGSWWIGTNVIALQMINRFDKYLNRDA